MRRPIVCGQGALIEGDFAGMAADDVAPKDSLVNVIDGVAMVTREPIDRLQQIIGGHSDDLGKSRYRERGGMVA